MRSIIAPEKVVALLASVLAAAAASGQTRAVEFESGTCNARVHVSAQNARLSDVLQTLAETLRFQLHFAGHRDPMINASLTGRGPDVISALLSQYDRFMIVTKRDKDCPSKLAVSRIWLLPEGSSDVSIRTFSRAVNAPAPGATEQRADLAARRAEESRKRKAAYEEYLRAHGQPPPGEEEEVSRP